MSKLYSVMFTQNYEVIIEADNENDAIDKAYPEFESHCRSSIADTTYDEVEVNCMSEDEDEEDEEGV